jgi:multidrug efflux pump subunit AcrA (membrane-fusion protein)
MTFWKNLRLRAVLIAAVSLAVIAAIGISVATASAGSTNSRWVTATAVSGDVTQTYLATGTISRLNTVTASFSATGTVNKVLVSVGDTVDAGQTLATVDTRALKLAVLEAETAVARAELSLYNAKHPASTSTTAASSSKTKSPNQVTVSIDLTALNAAVKRATDAATAETTACAAIMTWVNSEVKIGRAHV